jgi:hypothetical protein
VSITFSLHRPYILNDWFHIRPGSRCFRRTSPASVPWCDFAVLPRLIDVPNQVNDNSMHNVALSTRPAEW